MRAACADASRVRNPAKRNANARNQTQQTSNSEFDNLDLEDVPEANAHHNLGLVEGECGTHAVGLYRKTFLTLPRTLPQRASQSQKENKSDNSCEAKAKTPKNGMLARTDVKTTKQRAREHTPSR